MLTENIGTSVIGAPVFEEITFRWGIQEQLLRNVPKAILQRLGLNPKFADAMPARVSRVVVSSYLFAIAHDNSVLGGPKGAGKLGCTPQFLAGAAYESTGNLSTPIFMHALSNGLLTCNKIIEEARIREKGKDIDYIRESIKSEYPKLENSISLGSKKCCVPIMKGVGVAVGVAGVATAIYYYLQYQKSNIPKIDCELEADSVLSPLASKYLAAAFLYEGEMEASYKKMYKKTSIFNLGNYYYAPYTAYKNVGDGLTKLTELEFQELYNKLKKLVSAKSDSMQEVELEKISQEIVNEFDDELIIRYGTSLVRNQSEFFKADGIDSFEPKAKEKLKAIRKIISNLRKSFNNSN